MSIDYSNKYIGVARLRQHRSYNASCSFPEKMKFLNIFCISDFNTEPVYGNFSEEWLPVSTADQYNPMEYSWKYIPTFRAETLSHVGKHLIRHNRSKHHHSCYSIAFPYPTSIQGFRDFRWKCIMLRCRLIILFIRYNDYKFYEQGNVEYNSEP